MSVTDAPPQRYGVSFADTDRDWYSIAPRLRVFVDGVEMSEVVEYDCQAGTVLKINHGPDGQPLLTEDSVVHETVNGTVTVEWAD